jgi:hypothetical protein
MLSVLLARAAHCIQVSVWTGPERPSYTVVYLRDPDRTEVPLGARFLSPEISDYHKILISKLLHFFRELD